MKDTNGDRPNTLTLAAFLTAVLFLGVNFVAVRFSNMELPPFWGASLRFFIASSILFGIMRLRNIPLPVGPGLTGATLYGLFGFALTYGFLYWALTRVGAGTASVMFATIPLVTLLISSIMGMERITGRSLFGAMAVIAGVGLVFVEQLKFDIPFFYFAAVLLAVTSSSLSGIVVKYFPRSHPIATNTVGMGIGAILLLMPSLYFGETIQLPRLSATWLALGWLITSSIVAFVLIVWLLSRWSATATSYIGVLTPLVTIATAFLLTGEQPSPTFLGGALFVLLGVYAGVLTSQPAANRSSKDTN